MAILIVGGVTVPVQAPTSAQQQDEEVGGSRARMFSGLMRSTVRAFKRSWPITTRLLTATERTNVRAALRGTPPVACSGDVLGGSVNCFTQITNDQQQWKKGEIRYVLSFTLFEQ